jgi:hypothetical protein
LPQMINSVKLEPLKLDTVARRAERSGSGL